MGENSFKKLKAWFTDKQKLINDIKNLEEQLEESKSTASFLEKEYKEKSDLMDMLGEKEDFKRLADFGALDSIYNRLESYEKLQDYSKQLEKQIKKLKIELGKEEEEGE